MAGISAISLAWAFYLDGKLRNRPSPKHFDVQVEGTKLFTEEDLEAVKTQAVASLLESVAKSSQSLQSSLTVAMAGLTEKTDDAVQITLGQEIEKYQASFAALREETIREFNDVQTQLDKRRDDLMAQLGPAVAKAREERVDAINERIADVISSYLVEALDKGIDLGAQSKYIIHTLEAHKEDIKKDILS